MVAKDGRGTIDFSSYVADHTADFTGREWIFQDIDAWLANPDGSRFYLLTGEPGSGKTAIAGRLYRFPHCAISAPTGPGLLGRFVLGVCDVTATQDCLRHNYHVCAAPRGQAPP